MDEFESAVQCAIEQSQSAFQKLRHYINDGLSSLDDAAKIIQKWATTAEQSQITEPISTNTAQLAEQLPSLFKERNKQIKEIFDRQQQSLSTFNIVLFGRTGAGKSSLIEAFAKGNGATVSRGESDWTTEVRPLQWHSCLLFDTPGISGWGRTMSRSELEECAQLAVEIADVVLVCFDSQSQQATEFHHVADWVQKYGKPVVAVLNQRNSRWRMPTLVPIASARRSLSQSIVQHTSNIRDELGKIGLVGVPIVAISTKRALFARATEPFQGPDAETLKKHRSQYGIKQLESWSNFPALESLIIEAVNQDAVGLRLGMLREKACGVLRELIDELVYWSLKACDASNICEGLIEGTLRIVGYSPSDNTSSRKSFRNNHGDVDLLTNLEQLRGKPFQASTQGEFHNYTTHLLSAKFSPLRAKSLSEAEELVVAAFHKKQKLSAEDFKAQVFNQPAIEEAAQTVVKEAVNFLERKTKLLAMDAKSDFNYEIRGAEAKGGAGTDWKWAQYAAQGAMILSSIASTLAGLALVNWWNPFGWAAGVAAAVGFAGGLVSMAFSWLGGKAQKRAEGKRLETRRQTLDQARQSVNETYNRLIEKITQETNRISQEAAGKLLLPPLHEAVVLREVQIQTEATRVRLTEILNGIPAHTSAQLLLSQAASSVEQKHFPLDRAPGRKLWLGEDWISDATGLKAEDGSDSTVPTQGHTSDFCSQSFKGMRSVFTRISKRLQPGDGSAWLEEARNLLIDDRDACILLGELEALLEKGKPRLHLCGDYNAGKTSFIKRLLVDAGHPIPETLEVQAKPTTSQVAEYEWDEVLLVDSPGFQSSRVSDTEAAFRSFPDATAIFYLFQPNLVTGDTESIDLILKGQESRGILPKLERTFFIINRSDELGVDPTEAPQEYERLCQRKKEELVLALQSRGINISSEQVFCMASDPYGLVGNRQDVNSADFDPYRHWDDFCSFVSAYDFVRDDIFRVGVDLSVLEGGVARLGSLIARATQAAEEAQRKEASLNHLCLVLQEAIDEAKRIESELKTQLEQLVQDHAYGLCNDALSANSDNEIQKNVELLSKWWKDKAFQDELKKWQTKAHKSINDWYNKTQDILGRCIDSAEFKYAFPEINHELKEKKQFQIKNNQTKKILSLLEKSTKGATRDAAYQSVKFFNSSFKFKPWGAVKLAKNVAKVGAAIGVVGLAIDVYDIINSWQQETEREKARKELKKFVKETADEFCRALLKDSNGPLPYLQAQQCNLENQLQLWQVERESFSQEKDDCSLHKSKYTSLKNAALKRLGYLNGEGEDEK